MQELGDEKEKRRESDGEERDGVRMTQGREMREYKDRERTRERERERRKS